MADQKRCRTNLIADEPVDTDEFGSHGAVADAVVEVIHNECGGKAIGLEGGWGSGKSTVVNLVKDKLKRLAGKRYKVIVFDMWSHQGDPLRRTFLETLIAHFRKFEWVDAGTLDRRRDELAGRRRDEHATVKQSLTRAGRWFALALLAVPVGSVLFSAGITLWSSDNAPDRQIIFSLLSAGIAGILGPLIFYIVWLARNCKKRRRSNGESVDPELNEFPALLTGQSSTKTHTIVTQTPDPTSVEFERAFRDLLGKALKAPKHRKLLLVVDNLDRVQPSDALAIWSTLQTFLGRSDYSEDDWLDRLWVLIPYDRDGVFRLWDHSDGVQANPPSQSLTESFLDKTFQIRFRVPPLLLSKWRIFLGDSLKDVLPCHDEADFRDVYRAFGISGGLDKSPPTPRDLKIFANQIGALHRERQPDFALSDYACYVLFKKGVSDVHEALLKGDVSTSDDKYKLPGRIIGDHWRERIGAIHFGVTDEEARELLLRRRIESALAEGDGRILSDLAQDQPRGFWPVLEDSVPGGAGDWVGLNPDEISKAATALVDSRVFDHAEDRLGAAYIRRKIRDAVWSLPSWVPFDANNAQGMVDVVRLVGDSYGMIWELMAKATKAFQGQVPYDVWMASAFKFVGGIVDLGLEKRIGVGMKIPMDPDQWLSVSSKVAERDPDGRLTQYFELENIEQIDERLAQSITSGHFDDESLLRVKTTLATKSRSALRLTANAAIALHRQSRFQADQIARAMQLVFWIPRTHSHRTSTQTWLRMGGFLIT